MYIQITTRCNFSCAHCCYNCTKDGDDMTMETFRKALKVCEDNGDMPFLGGGEPTLHKDFLLMLIESMACDCHDEGIKVGVVTNGSITKTALLLAKLTKSGAIDADVSRDDYHDQIDEEVYEAFEALGRHGSHFTNVRNTTARREPSPHGRGAALMGYDEDNPPELEERDCMCDDWLVKPNGDIHQCGCETSPVVGNVDDGIESTCRVCHLSSEFVEDCLENDKEYLLY